MVTLKIDTSSRFPPKACATRMRIPVSSNTLLPKACGTAVADRLDFQCPFLPILPSARNFDTAHDFSDNGQPRRTHASAPCNSNLHANKYPESLARILKEPRRCSTPQPAGLIRSKRACESSGRRWSPPPISPHNSGGIIYALPSQDILI
ncbi:hypothetical protein EVAR_34279_1 [Eumeta japonica]|uniref:Uncharacterized protein n=1 Tax=Eumeta variegata TaxID=151549 RepID=A0A4C1VX44_EUMVA|nr:hypothetical protein EVAR_34279_1 [Eumeta japonica]